MSIENLVTQLFPFLCFPITIFFIILVWSIFFYVIVEIFKSQDYGLIRYCLRSVLKNFIRPFYLLIQFQVLILFVSVQGSPKKKIGFIFLNFTALLLLCSSLCLFSIATERRMLILPKSSRRHYLPEATIIIAVYLLKLTRSFCSPPFLNFLLTLGYFLCQRLTRPFYTSKPAIITSSISFVPFWISLGILVNEVNFFKKSYFFIT